MKYQDLMGTDIKVGDVIVYSRVDGGLQLGRVLELIEQKNTWGIRPTIKIIGARREWQTNTFKKFSRPSLLHKLDNVLVLHNHLGAAVTLM